MNAESENYRYTAFISYRHVEPDRRWAKWLHTALETYRVPKRLVAERRIAARVGRVFRDEEEIPASADLGHEIEQALAESRVLIVVCSPRTPESSWVNREIECFREMGRGDHILALLIEGEPRDAFPQSLREIRRRMVDATGAEVERILEVEPLAADVRAQPGSSMPQRRRHARLSLAAILIGCRFDDLRRRENERRMRRVRGLAAGLAVLVLLMGGLTALAVGARGEADRSAEAAANERDEVLRLADVETVREIVAEADTLWPVNEDKAAVMAGWLKQARDAVARRAIHEASLARLRSQPQSFGSERSTAWRLQVLAELLAGLDSLQDPNEKAKGLISTIEVRQRDAETLRKRSIGDHAEKWRLTVDQIAASPRFGGRRIVEQLGLVPLGPDRKSGLFEFAHLGSGSLPTRDPATQRLVCADDAAIVLVLIPGGTFQMGAQNKDPKGSNYDPDAEENESPLHAVTLSAFFLAKHECTQSQWKTMTGGLDPSDSRSGETYGGRTLTDRNPVETVSWQECAGERGWLVRQGLSLPTEAQWEYACRAGHSTPWFVGGDIKGLSGVANIADRYWKVHEHFVNLSYSEQVDDGYSLHAPVGSLAANDFGLYDIHGNVSEWCLDAYQRYSQEPAVDPLMDGNGNRVYRGGAWYFPAASARSAARFRYSPNGRNVALGVRPARRLDK